MSGVVCKFVHCQHCKAEYVYRMQRTGSGGGTSFLFLDNQGASNRASSQAEKELYRKLSEGIDLVPCPTCYRYQSDMVLKALKKYHRWMLQGAVFSFLAILPVAFFGLFFSLMPDQERNVIEILVVAFFTVVLGATLLILRSTLLKKYDPNEPRTLNTRQKIARQRAMLKTEFEAMNKGPVEKTKPNKV